MSSIIQSAGEIDILVPCATALQPDNLTRNISTDDFAETFTVNAVAVHHLVKEFLTLPSTKASGARKSVVHISSAGSQLQTAHGLSAYCASKAAANQVITHFANDEPDSNVKFYSLHPGAIYSPMAQAAREKDAMLWEDGGLSPFFPLATMVSCLLTTRLTEKLPGDMSVWLASPEAEFLNGRYLWSQWDVDELISMKEKVTADPSILTFSLVK